MKKFLLTSTLMLATAFAANAAPIRIASEGGYAPFNLVNDDGNLAGFDIDVGNAVCERAGLECVWVKNDWDSIIPNLVSGNYDAIMAGMSVIEERKTSISFTEAYFPPETSAYAALSEDADLDGTIAAQSGTIQADHIAAQGADLVEFSTMDENVAAVRNGEVDAVFADKAALAPTVAESSDLVWVGEEVALDEGIAIGLRKSDTELLTKLDTALEEMKADGSLNELIKKHFGEDAAGF